MAQIQRETDVAQVRGHGVGEDEVREWIVGGCRAEECDRPHGQQGAERAQGVDLLAGGHVGRHVGEQGGVGGCGLGPEEGQG